MSTPEERQREFLERHEKRMRRVDKSIAEMRRLAENVGRLNREIHSKGGTMKGKKLRSVGVSPKAPAAGLSAVIATLVVALVAEQFDTKLDVNTVQAIVGAVVAGAGALVGAVAARPGPVVAEGAKARTRRSEAGQAGVGLVVFVLVVIVVVFFLKAVTGSWLVFLLLLILLLAFLF